jgi:uncharacterized protein
VIAVDTNLLVYAHREDAPWYKAAFAIVKELAESPAAWAIPWPCIHEFLSIVTHPRIYRPPTPLPRALAQIDAWLESPSLQLLSERPGFWRSSRPLLSAARVSGPVVHDARVAALCIEHGVRELWSADRDFSKFGGIRVRNPLAG